MFSLSILSALAMHFSVLLCMDHPQSDISLTGGFTFQPKVDPGEWLDNSITDTVYDCARQCNLQFACRTFVYNAMPYECHLYQVEPDPNQIVPSSSSILGYVRLTADLYQSHNKSCKFCENDRYLICDPGYCRCPWNAFWNGLICQKQKYAMELCSANDQCRDNPFGLTCNQANIYIPSTQGGLLVSLRTAQHLSLLSFL